MNAAVRRAGWATACVLAAALLQSYFQQPVSPVAAAAVLAGVVLTAWRPFEGLLLLAGLGPLSAVLLGQGRGEAGAIFYAEVVALAFLAGWTARQVVESAPLRVPAPVRVTALLLALAAAASAIVHSARARVELQSESAGEFGRLFLRDYVLHLPGAEPLTAAAPFAAGMLLILAAAHLTAGMPERRAAVLRLMVCGAAAAALFNLNRFAQVALSRESGGLAAFFELFATQRVNVHYTDRNAAGSYFAMLLMLSVAVATRARVLGAAAIACSAAGLWMSGSRVALAAVGVAGVLALAGSVWRLDSRRMRVGALAAGLMLLVVGGAVWKWYPEGRNIGARQALGIRLDLARAGVEMTRDSPVFGVGLGRYYVLSSEYAGEALRALTFTRENAHNNFVQIAAELGVPGLVAFIVLLWASLRELARTPSPEHWWIGAGLVAYLLTCMGGHPLLVADAAIPFWLALGLAAGASAAGPIVTPSARWRVAPAAIALLLVVSIWPRAAAAARTANLEHVSVGLSRWQHDPDGSRYRWAGGRSAFYVPADASAVRIPLRNGVADRRTIEVAILLDGREADRILLPANDLWRTARVVLRANRTSAFTRVDLIAYVPGDVSPLETTATDTSGSVHVGRPSIEP